MVSILALDFDGVLCDSLPECYFSSALSAFPGISQSELLQEIEKRSPRFLKFCRWRPFVRSGEDYVFIQHQLDRDLVPETQMEMDALLAQAGPEQMTQFKRTLYEVRDTLLAQEKPLWLSLNPVFPFLKPFLVDLSRNEHVWILSTKRPSFIREILLSNGVQWEGRRILEAAGERKIHVMDRHWGEQAAVVFLDDQPDHFQGLPDRVRCVLPTWGYAKEEWVRGGMETLDPSGVEEFLAPWVKKGGL